MNDRASSVLVDREGNLCSDPSHVAELHALRTHLICARECMVAAESYRLRSYMASSRAEHAALLAPSR